MGFCSFCRSDLNESDDGPEFPHSLGGKRSDSGAALQRFRYKHAVVRNSASVYPELKIGPTELWKGSE
jgi:hypothetical protein